jgi:phage terminase large subunit GpA-like protein
MLAETHNPHRAALLDGFEWLIERSRAPRLRTMREFAEQEVWLNKGPLAGTRYRCSTQPYSALFFEECMKPWQIIAATGPRQSGKTLTFSIIPLLYHLFELQEDVLFLLPDMKLAGSKWRKEIKPAIERTRYEKLMPRRGDGSRGGEVNAVTFANGVELEFITGGGGDAARAGRTARVLIVTEVDRLDTSSESSEEANKVTQAIHCTDSFDATRRIYLEGTLSTETARTWREIQAGTASRLMLHCPHCAAWVTPEREHLTGWKEAADEYEARDRAAYTCPSCYAPWSEEDRAAANREAKLLHRGQAIDSEGNITGDVPRTDTLGFRVSCVNNMFMRAGTVGVAEWRRLTADNEDDAERELLQFFWALPYKPPTIEVTELTHAAVMARQDSQWDRGVVPTWTELITLGCDIQLRLAYWIVAAWNKAGRAHLVDYGAVEAHVEELGQEPAILLALREFRDSRIETGWGGVIPEVCMFDSRYSTKPVRMFTMESGGGYMATAGYGSTQRRTYSAPKSKTGRVIDIGDHYHVVKEEDGAIVTHVDADHWKGQVHKLLTAPMGMDGSMSLFRKDPDSDEPKPHFKIAKHFTSERRIEEIVPGRGPVIRWTNSTGRANHYLDCAQLAAVGAHMAGVRIIRDERETPQPRAPARVARPRLETPDGRPYWIMDR